MCHLLFFVSISVSILILIRIPSCESQADPPQNGLLHNLVNSAQLGLKNVIDRLIPDVALPNLMPPRAVDIELPSLSMPQIIGDTNLLTFGCPKCKIIQPNELAGTWHMVYANDNFIKIHLLALAKAQASLASGGRAAGASDSFMTLGHLISPTQMPVCVRFTIGQPISFGFLIDYPIAITYSLGIPNGPQIMGYGRLRHLGEGKYILIFAGINYQIRFCLAETNAETMANIDPETMSHIPNPFESSQFQRSFPIPQPTIITGTAAGAPVTPRGRTITTKQGPNEDYDYEKYSVRIQNSGNSTSENGNSRNGSNETTSTTTIPFGTTEVPSRKTEKPSRTTEAPFGTTEAPFRTLEVPSRKTEKPSRTTDAPSGTTEAPFRTFEVPTYRAPFGTTTTARKFANLEMQRSKYLILSDMGGVPACQNYLVFTQDTVDFFTSYDPIVMNYLNLQRAHTEVNPVVYTGCPYALEKRPTNS